MNKRMMRTYISTVSLVWLATFLLYTPGYANDFTREQLRQIFISHFNTGRSLAPVDQSGQALGVQVTGKLLKGSEETLGVVKATGRFAGTVFSALAGCLIGFIAANVPGCGIGAAIGGGAGGTLFSDLSAEANKPPPTPRGDPFVEDVVIMPSISIAGEGDVTGRVVGLASAHIVSQARLNLKDTTISFADPDIFHPTLVDSSGEVVSQILGTDVFLLDGPAGRAFGYIVYNDPVLTGRSVTPTDQFRLDLSAITNQPPGTEFKYTAVPVVAGDVIESGLPLVNKKLDNVATAKSFDPNPCSPNAPAGTFIIGSTFKNISSNNLSNLVVELQELTGGNVLCNGEGGPTAIRPTLLLPLEGHLGDGLLTSGEDVFIEFKIGLVSSSTFTFLVDVRGLVQ